MNERTELLQGTLELIVLKTLALGPLHGWGISKWVEVNSDNMLSIGQGSLYPALYRLEDRGVIRSEWSASPEGRRVKIYSLTAAGRKELARQTESWRTFSAVLEQMLRTT
jgi:transcriptional regulator